ncbi:hypothetical protein MTMBA_11180 [Moorella thermoacetica]
MTNLVSVSLLKPHPKNGEYFSAPSPEEREAIKRSIEIHGIRDPLKVLPDYTVIAGHVRLEIAKELGIEKVPVEVWDVLPEEAEYLLVADNEERRVCQDPIKKAKRAKFLKEYWKVKRGGDRKSKGQNVLLKTFSDIAKVIGEDEKTVQRVLKLNDLIIPLQDLVSQGRLSQTTAYSLAFLSPEEQERLLKVLGESGICGLSVKEAQELRREIETERKRAEELARRLAEYEKALAIVKEDSAEATRLKAEIDALRKENAELKARQPEIVEKVVEKVVYKPDPAVLAERDAARAEVDRLTKELESVNSRLRYVASEGERDRAKAKKLEEEADRLRRMLETAKKELRMRKERPLVEDGNAVLREYLRKAGGLASELSEVLDSILSKHKNELLAASRSRGNGHMELEEIVGNVGDAMAFKFFKVGVDLAADRIVRLYEALEEKPALKVLKGGFVDVQKS